MSILNFVSSKKNREDEPKNSDASHSCCVCDLVINDSPPLKDQGNYFCQSHFEEFKDRQWKTLITVRGLASNPARESDLRQLRKQIWESDLRPSLLETVYKINIEEELVEYYTTLTVLQEDNKFFLDRV